MVVPDIKYIQRMVSLHRITSTSLTERSCTIGQVVMQKTTARFSRDRLAIMARTRRLSPSGKVTGRLLPACLIGSIAGSPAGRDGRHFDCATTRVRHGVRPREADCAQGREAS